MFSVYSEPSTFLRSHFLYFTIIYFKSFLEFKLHNCTFAVQKIMDK